VLMARPYICSMKLLLRWRDVRFTAKFRRRYGRCLHCLQGPPLRASPRPSALPAYVSASPGVMKSVDAGTARAYRRLYAPTGLNAPARARQQRDRPPQRRRRDLPQRAPSDPSRRRAADRAERRMARPAPLPLRRVDDPDPRRGADRGSRASERINGSDPTRRGVSRQRPRGRARSGAVDRHSRGRDTCSVAHA
jgi:hypothetical protein